MELRIARGTGLLCALILLAPTSVLEGQALPYPLAHSLAHSLASITGEGPGCGFVGLPGGCPDPLPLSGGLLQDAGSHWKTGAGIGLAVGGVGTYLVLRSGDSTAPCNQSANQDAWSTSACLGAAAAGGVVGAGVGALIGSRFRKGRGSGSFQYLPSLGPGAQGGLRMQMRVR